MQLGALEYLISLNSSNLGKDMKKADKTLTSWAVAKGQLIGRTLERAMAAAGKSLKKVVGGAFSSFADYEQLTGGVETLFKKSADQVKKYAEQAYKTAGISANQYMETVTSFSASLLQSLGGDTAKAADYADMAVKDMSDNANLCQAELHHARQPEARLRRHEGRNGAAADRCREAGQQNL